jgi:hypothetical protein
MTYKRQKARRLSSRAFEKRDLDGVPGNIARDARPIKSGKSPRPTSVVHAAFAVKSQGVKAKVEGYQPVTVRGFKGRSLWKAPATRRAEATPPRQG